MRKWLFLFFLIGLFGGLVRWKWRDDDFRIGIVTPNDVALLSISPGRGMINLLTVDSEVELWLPGGMGWYQANRIKKIFEKDKNMELIFKTLYYNFGFIPEKIVYLEKVSDWRNWSLIKYLGPFDWVRYKIFQENWLYKSEVISRSLSMEKENLDEILPRDFSDNELLSGEVKISVVNASGENGLGSFVADRLNWMGFSVVGVETETDRKECQIMSTTTPSEITKKNVDNLAKMFGCSQTSNVAMLPDEAIIYLGQNYAQMLKYSTYVRSF